MAPLHLCLLSTVLAVVMAACASGTSPSNTSCPAYRCGDAVDIRYPLWIGGNGTGSSHCGYSTLQLQCRRGMPVLPLPSGEYAVRSIAYGDRTMTLLDLQVSVNGSCPLVTGRNLTLPPGSPPPLSLTHRDINVSFFIDCSFEGISSQLVSCLESADGWQHTYFFRDGDYLLPSDYVTMCKQVVGMPILRSSTFNTSDPVGGLITALNRGFELSWRPAAGGACAQCENAGGFCGQRRDAAQGSWAFTCAENSTASPSWAARPKSSGLFLGLVVGGGISLICLVPTVIFFMEKLRERQAKRLKAKHFKQNRGLLLQQLVDKDIAERMIFSLEELEKATHKFDVAYKLGGGSHGNVYKGILANQDVVAIKKSKMEIQREIDDFVNEVAVLSQINHRNVVKLIGCCLETQVPLLVYEFISNGTLSNHLYVEGPNSLSWKDRLRIARETASALAYLHSSASTSIIHRDVKSSNILLDQCLIAKVADFGASRGMPIGQTGVTTTIQGTFGYLDPEYYQTSVLTDKSDVYSFGVILLELLTRKKPSAFMQSEGISLIARFNLLRSQDNLHQILDQQVMLESMEDAKEVAALASTCLNLRGEERPTMRQVEMALERLIVENENTGQGSSIDLNRRPLAQISNQNDSNSRQYSAEQDMLLSASFPR